MLDSALQKWLRPSLESVARRLVSARVSANSITVTGFLLGLGAASAIAFRSWLWGLVLLLLSRLCDGLDGAVARLKKETDWGAFLDITLDFIFYASVPLGFIIANPMANALAGSCLLFSFMGTASSFLAFATMAEKRGICPGRREVKNKGFFFVGGLTEATETLSLFVLMCLQPHFFAVLAFIFSFLCVCTTVSRILYARKIFGNECFEKN